MDSINAKTAEPIKPTEDYLLLGLKKCLKN